MQEKLENDIYIKIILFLFFRCWREGRKVQRTVSEPTSKSPRTTLCSWKFDCKRPFGHERTLSQWVQLSWSLHETKTNGKWSCTWAVTRKANLFARSSKGRLTDFFSFYIGIQGSRNYAIFTTGIPLRQFFCPFK